ncbi:uncharacterized protein G6M90_00g082350 [Metarhizium brunneum]|uniref:BTB domain-containing protein n=1 Tax=Metarhizium brunneum TaxID=500148 RepID=A0A7D5V0Y1_9HYPO
MESLTDEMALMRVTSPQSEPETTTVELCTNGDVTLVVEHKRFVVSSEILKISSDYFSVLFIWDFSEGKAIQNGGNTEIVLHEDDPEVMEIILSILHYSFQPNLHHLEPQMILKVAQHSDKYQCNKPLTPWIMQWMQKAQKPGSVRHFDYLLTAAHIFGAEEYLNTTSVAAIRNLPPNFNVANDELFLPENLQNELARRIRGMTEDIRDSIELVFEHLGAPGYAFWSKEMSPVPQHCFQAPIVYESKPKNGILRHPSPFVSLAY